MENPLYRYTRVKCLGRFFFGSKALPDKKRAGVVAALGGGVSIQFRFVETLYRLIVYQHKFTVMLLGELRLVLLKIRDLPVQH